MDPGSELYSAVVRKCLGKAREACTQLGEHPHSRWECAFQTTSKEEFDSHCKNIMKKRKWREMILALKTDVNGLYHCVYYSTDRHHVENHYEKASAVHQMKSQLTSASPTPKKKWQLNFPDKSSIRESDNEDDEIVEDEGNVSKRLKTDTSNTGGVQLVPAVPDNTRTEELMDAVEKKLQVPHELCAAALDLLHKHGFFIAAGLKTLSKEAWERLNLLGLPLAIVEELKIQLSTKALVNNLSTPVYVSVYSGYDHNHTWFSGQYNSAGQPIYYFEQPLSDQTEKDADEDDLHDKDLGKVDDKIMQLTHPLEVDPSKLREL